MKDNVISIEENPRFRNVHIKNEYDIIDSENIAWHEIQLSQTEAASTNQGGAGEVENVYQQLIDRLDQDMRDHKQEMRDRDAQYQRDAQEREKRYREEMKDRMDTITNIVSDSEKRIENRMDRMESRLDGIEDHTRSLVNTNFWQGIATIIGIAAIAVAVWLGIR